MSGRNEVGLWIGGVVELVEDYGSLDFVAQFFGPGNGSGHTELTRSKDDFGAIGQEQFAALDAHAVGHSEDKPVSANSADPSEPYACVSGCRLDNSSSGPEDALQLGLIDHILGHTVFNAATRIESFEFEQQLGGCINVLVVAYGFEQGSVADNVGKIFDYLLHRDNKLYV